MQSGSIKKFAQIMSMQAEIEGMKLRNLLVGEDHVKDLGYLPEEFFKKADEISNIASDMGRINLITAHVQIGKSKEIVNRMFHERDFIRIDEDKDEIVLVLKGEDRKLKIDQECKKQIFFQMNQL